MVGATAEQLEPDRGAVLNIKHDVDRILQQHSYAHPAVPTISITENSESGGDKPEILYTFDDASDCITIEVPSEEPEKISDINEPLAIDTNDFLALTNNGEGITFECDMKLLSPMSLSPQSVDENLLAVSPSHTSLSSDLGYESLASPLSEPDSMDLTDFWSESLNELFPGLV